MLASIQPTTSPQHFTILVKLGKFWQFRLLSVQRMKFATAEAGRRFADLTRAGLPKEIQPTFARSYLKFLAKFEILVT